MRHLYKMAEVKEMKESFRPVALVNITNRCNLKCKHCFVFREGTPNTPTKNEMSAEKMIKEIKKSLPIGFIIILCMACSVNHT